MEKKNKSDHVFKPQMSTLVFSALQVRPVQKALVSLVLAEFSRPALLSTIRKLCYTLRLLAAYRHEHPHVQHTVDDLDFPAKLAIVEALVMEMEAEEHHRIQLASLTLTSQLPAPASSQPVAPGPSQPPPDSPGATSSTTTDSHHTVTEPATLPAAGESQTPPDTSFQGKALQTALAYMHESIEQVHRHVETLNHMVEQHQRSWFFTRWRSLDCTLALAQLHKSKQVFDGRFDLLIKIVQCTRDRKPTVDP